MDRYRPRGQLPLPGARVASRRSVARGGGRRQRRVDRSGVVERLGTLAAPQDPRHHSARDARHRCAAANEHRRLGDDGTGQRAVCLHREGRAIGECAEGRPGGDRVADRDAVAVCAAYDGRVVADVWPWRRLDCGEVAGI